jgi:prefoldin subunit 5
MSDIRELENTIDNLKEEVTKLEDKNDSLLETLRETLEHISKIESLTAKEKEIFTNLYEST